MDLGIESYWSTSASASYEDDAERVLQGQGGFKISQVTVFPAMSLMERN
jgi:hypothetical protein